MTQKIRSPWFRTTLLFLLFALFTLSVLTVDVRPIGPEGSPVGWAGFNRFVFQHIGCHPAWQTVTEWLGMLALLFPLGFGTVGLGQLLRRRSLRRVDPSLLVLGAFYLLVLLCYLLFEQFPVNVRPVLMDGVLEPSYPSSHTLLVLCVMTTAKTQLRILWPGQTGLHLAMDRFADLLMALTVLGRLLSGVHWLTDILGSLLLWGALVSLYHAGIQWVRRP